MFNSDPLVQQPSSVSANQPRKHLHEIQLDPDPKRRRFARPLSQTEIDDCCKPCVPKNTQSNTSWGVRVFSEWVKDRNSGMPSACPENLLTVQHPISVLDYWLAAFILEARRQDGNYYPGNTVRNILAALFRYMKENLGVKNAPNFIDRAQREANFPRLHNALDRHLKMLRNSGIGVEINRASVITTDMENRLWELGILGTHSGQALLNAVFFYNGKNFLLRGVQEHVDLCFGQLTRGTNPIRYTYVEHGSKNHSGGVSDLTDGKTVTIVHSHGSRSHTMLLDLYLSKIPSEARQPNSRFYLRPLPFTPTGSRSWFWNSPLGTKKIQTMVKDMMQEASIPGNFTNHSLRATGTTTLFDAGVPEALIQKRSGHKSTKALRVYERVTPEQDQAVSRILHSDTAISYKAAKAASTDQSFNPDLSYSDEDLKLFEQLEC